MKETYNYCRTEWKKLIAFIPSGGMKGFMIKLCTFFLMGLVSYAVYFIVPLLIGLADCYYDTRVNVVAGQKFNGKRFLRGWLDKWCSFGFLLLMFFAIEYVIKRDVHYGHYWLLLATSTIISTHEAVSICASMGVLHPSWKFVQALGNLLGVVQKKITDKTENILS